MRIVLVNWAKIGDGASRGGGVNGYCQAIGLELARRGHEVISLCSGTTYEAGEAQCHLRRLPDWRGIAVHEVVNSPVLAPAMAQFADPMGEVSAPELERVLGPWLAEQRADVVHFHNIEGFSASVVGLAKRSGARTVYSLHNYHTVCPQVYLMQGHRRPCFTFENGHACEGCIPTADPSAEREKRAGAQAEARTAPARPWLPPPPWETIDVPAWRPLLNVIQPEPRSAREPTAYATRRAAMIAMLNSCDRVLAVSDFVRRKYESFGVIPSVISTQRIGCSLDPGPRPPSEPMHESRPIRLAFVGYHNWFKGLPMLADSLELLTPEVLGRFDLTVLALNAEHMEAELRRLEGRLAGLRIGFGYQNQELPRLLNGIDLGIVPSVWWDNGPQTVMEFLACGTPVLGAQLGGIPEFIRDGENGLLFRGNDRWDLARRLAEVARWPRMLDRLKAGIRPPKSIGSHVTELEQEYANRLSS